MEQFESRVKCIEDTWVKIDLQFSSLYLCTVYVTPSVDRLAYIQHFECVLNSIDNMQDDGKIIIGGDYNLPSIHWMESTFGIEPLINDSNDVTDALFDTMTYAGLNQFNSALNSHNGILDLLLSNFDLHHLKVARSDVSIIIREDDYHPTLSACITVRAKYIKERQMPRRNFKKANYDTINGELSRVNWQFTDDLPANAAVDKFYSILNDVIARNVPLQRRSNKYPRWFSFELIGLLRRKERARTRWKNSNLNADYEHYSELRLRAKSLARCDGLLRHLHCETTE